MHSEIIRKWKDSIPENQFAFFKEEQKARQNRSEELKIPFLDGFDCPLLPFIISTHCKNKIESDLSSLYRLIPQLCERLFKDNWIDYADNLGIDRETQHFAFQFGDINSFKAEIGRPDTVLSEDGIKVLEFNIGSGIGGIPISQNRVSYYSANEAIRSFFSKLGHELFFYHTLENFATYLKRFPTPICILPSIKPFNPNIDWGIISKFLNYQMEYICNAVEECTLGSADRLSYDQQVLKINSLVPATFFVNFSTYQWLKRRIELSKLEQAFSENRNPVQKLILPPSSLLFENKGNIALLSAYAKSGAFSSEETDVILRCIPWTRAISPHLAEMISAQREKYVLKKNGGHGGSDVVFGKLMSTADFDAHLRQALHEGNWIVQEFIEPKRFENCFLSEGQLAWRDCGFTLKVFLFDFKIGGFDCLISVDGETGYNGIPGFQNFGGGAIAVLENFKE